MVEEKTKSERIEYLEEMGKELCEILKNYENDDSKFSLTVHNYERVITLLIEAMLEEYDYCHNVSSRISLYITPRKVYLMMTKDELLTPFTVKGIGEKRNSIYNMIYGYGKRPFTGFKPGKINQSPIPLGFNNHKSKPFYTNCLRGNNNE